MGPVTALALLALVCAVPLETPGGIAQWHPLIVEAAARFGMPIDWITRVMRAESGGRATLNGRPITSPKGAMGLMQLMPATYADMARRFALGADPYLPRDNILAGAAYLRLMYDRFGYPGLFAAYNAGPARYAEHLRTGRRLPEETWTYLAVVGQGTIAGTRARLSEPAIRPRISVFFPLGDGPRGQDFRQDSSPNTGLFLPLRQPESAPK